MAGRKPETYIVAGGHVEVYEAKSSSWKTVPRNKSVRSTDFVRSDGSFMLRQAKRFSHSFDQCDCTLVSKLSPAKMLKTVSMDNDVVTRNKAILLKDTDALARELEAQGWKPCGTSSIIEYLDSISTRISANPRKYLFTEGNGSACDCESAVKDAEKDASTGISFHPASKLQLIRPNGDCTEARVYLLFEIK